MFTQAGILLEILEKATALDSPWSVTQVSSMKKKRKNVIVFTQKCDFHNISCMFFLFLVQ